MRISRDRMTEWEPTDRQSRLSSLIPERDYKGLNGAESQLRLWLPEPARIGLEDVCERMDTSMTVFLTEFFVSYLYGFHELLRMRESRLGIYAPLERRACMMDATPQPPLPDLGKNIFAVKIFLPGRVKKELERLAERSGSTLGEFARALICAHLFGWEYGARRIILWTEEEEQLATSWEAEV